MSVHRITLLCLLAASCSFDACGADAKPGAGRIYSCIKDGRKITQDHPIAECADTDQVEHNKDGSPKRIVPRQETEEERGAREAKERIEAAEETERKVEAKRDKLLLKNNPDKPAHDAARMRALDEVRRSIDKIDERRKILIAERKPLLDEAEFYVGKAQPFKLKSALDSNEAQLAAQTELRQGQEAEMARINKRFDGELERLRKMWAAPPGTLKTNTSAAPNTK